MLSSKGKMRLALFVIAAIPMGTAAISLFYMNSMVTRIETVAERDANMAELGEEISIKILEARREEKNFLIYGDPSYVETNRRILKEIGLAVGKAREIPGQYGAELDSIELLVSEYGEHMELLLAVTESNENTRVVSRLRETGNAIQGFAQKIGSRAQESLLRNSWEGVRYGVRAQRNAVTIFMITALLLIYLIFYFPQRIFFPVRRMVRTLRAMGRGETGFPFPNADSGDELGELSRAFQDAVGKLRLFNQLKTDRIVDTKRKLRRILEEVNESVLIVSADLKIEYLNRAARDLFALKEEVLNKSVKDVPELCALTEDWLDDIGKSGRLEYGAKIKKTDLRKKSVSAIPNMSKNGKLESILIIVK